MAQPGTPAMVPMADGPTLLTPLAELPGITPALARSLETLNLRVLGQLIAHLPLRHERIEALAPIADLVPEQLGTAEGEVTATRLAGQFRKQRFEAVLMDGTGRLDLVWFNAPYLRNAIKPGTRLRVEGKPRRYGPGLQIANPKHTVLAPSDDDRPSDDAPTNDQPAGDATFRAIYPASEAVPSRKIARAIQTVLDRALPLIDDHLPADYRASRALPSLADAYRMIHRPGDEDEAAAARRRLAFDELLILQLGVHMKRAQLRRARTAPALAHSADIDHHIRARFPFTLTRAQDAVLTEIVADLTTTTPTNRLIQGDVGSGKTVIALYAMLMAVASGHQAALMAPTEILAEQHFASIARALEGSRVRVELLTGATPQADRDSILARLAAGDIDLLIGTHSLITDRVRYHSLAVAIIDEQHRFGVQQRAAMRASTENDRATPHVLVMTATPIPRSLALTLFGDLDLSVIDQLPPGRTPIATRVVDRQQRDEVFAWIRERLAGGEQAYIVVPAVDTQAGDSDLADVRSTVAELEAGPLKGLRVAGMHGRLKRDTREHIMHRFRAGLIDCLVATTVIEVGVDVPNATIMAIDNAERFGLAQLHQLRGRVGRGDKPSACILLADPTTDDAQARLDAIASTTDGFKLAEQDFALRGFGEIFGSRQSGLPPFKVADLMRDIDLLTLARRDAAEWIDRSPDLDAPDEHLLRTRMMKHIGPALGLADVG